jgi:predicted metal-dependent hydrolase
LDKELSHIIEEIELIARDRFHFSKVESIAIKHLKNRWGSMTKEGSINLNVNLLKSPEDVIDYIILHELCHFKIEAHSHHYWNHVRRYMPNYQEKVEWLKISGNHLI